MTDKVATQYVVTIFSTEPPPGNEEKQLAKLTRELELMYGANATVEKLEDSLLPGDKL